MARSIKHLFTRRRKPSVEEQISSAYNLFIGAATELQPPPDPKSLKQRASLPSHLTSAKTSDSVLPENDNRIANLDITTLRSGRSTKETINNLSKASPDLAAAVASAIRLAISQKYNVLAYDRDGVLNPDGTRLAQQLCRKFDLLGPYDVGFNSYGTLRRTSEALSRELLVYGGCSAELVLDKTRLPEAIVPVTTVNLVWKQKKSRTIPVQKVGGEEIVLDIPTFFYTSLDQDLKTAYSESPVSSAVQPILQSQEFMNDLRRIFKRAIHPRPTVKIIEENWKKSIPEDILYDKDKLSTYMKDTITELENTMNGLEPEDALIFFDSLEMDILDKGNVSLSDEYKVLNQILNGKLSSGTKTVPVVLGHEAAGSTNIASTQSMLFVKAVEGAVQSKLNEIYSRIFTLALRLFGLDVVVEFKYEPIDLRPDLELEAFKAMKQDRIMTLWSFGLYSDEEASILLKGALPPQGLASLSGTRFYTPAKDPSANPASNTSPGQGGALNQTLKPDTPAQPRGK